MARRPPPPASRLRLLALGVAAAMAAVACGDLSLSSSTAGAPAAPPLNDLDAAAEAAPASAGADSAGASDAGGYVPWSRLCSYETAIPGRSCHPDDSWNCAPVPEAGAPASGDAGGDAGVPLSACHVMSANGEPMPACTVAGTGADGAQCQTGADCAASYECVGSPGRCRRYCCAGDKSCAAAAPSSFCDLQPVASRALDAGAGDAGAASYLVPVCMPVGSCKFFEPTACPASQTCAVVKDDGSTSCVDVGPVAAGQSCDLEHCQAGLTCLGSGPTGRVCYQLCKVDQQPSACPAMQTCISSAQIFKDPSVGLCQ